MVIYLPPFKQDGHLLHLLNKIPVSIQLRKGVIKNNKRADFICEDYFMNRKKPYFQVLLFGGPGIRLKFLITAVVVASVITF